MRKLFLLLLPLGPSNGKHAAWIETLKHLRAFQREHDSDYFKGLKRWDPESCPSKAGGPSGVKQPTLWLIGNSVSRIHFFAALAMLSGSTSSNVTVLDQITQCGRGGEWKGRRPGQGVSCLGPCSCSDQVPGLNMSVVFVWQQQVWDRTLHSSLLGAQFSAGQSPIAPGDVVLLNGGMDAVSILFKRAFAGKKFFGSDGRTVKGNYTFFASKWRQTLASESEQLATSIAAAWHTGRRVFWRTTTPDCYPRNATRPEFAVALQPGKPAWAAMALSHYSSLSQWYNALINESDATVRAALRRHGLPVLDMVDVDIAVNGCREGLGSVRRDEDVLRCRCNGYVDRTWLHPGPMLASRQVAQLLQVTNDHCML